MLPVQGAEGAGFARHDTVKPGWHAGRLSRRPGKGIAPSLFAAPLRALWARQGRLATGRAHAHPDLRPAPCAAGTQEFAAELRRDFAKVAWHRPKATRSESKVRAQQPAARQFSAPLRGLGVRVGWEAPRPPHGGPGPVCLPGRLHTACPGGVVKRAGSLTPRPNQGRCAGSGCVRMVCTHANPLDATRAIPRRKCFCWA